MLLLAACSKGGPSPYEGTKGPVGVKLGKPYTVLGQYYEPKYDPNYQEEGIASWYGPGFHGRMTASGEEFDTSEMTCAHRTLPMPSLVRVENLDNGREAIVRVNDRGPFAKSRIIDLSSAAADRLGVKSTGTARVRVTYLKEETEDYIADLGLDMPEWMRGGGSQYAQHSMPSTTSPRMRLEEQSEAAPLMPATVMASDLPPPEMSGRAQVSKSEDSKPNVPSIRASYTPIVPESASSYSVQTGSFTARKNAESHASTLAQLGQSAIREVIVNGKQFFRVSFGPVSTAAQAQQMLEQARALGFTDARILVN
jgi:rare lipoprotein A